MPADGAVARSRATALLGAGSAARVARALYLRWLELRHGRRGVPWRIHTETIRIDPRVRHLLPSSAEPKLFEHLRRGIRPGDVVLDVGGFLGAYALCEARWAGPSGRVVMLEPTPWSAAIARAQLRMNLEGARVTVVEAAATDRSGRVTLALHDEPYRNSIGGAAAAPGAGETLDVPAVAIDDLCREMDLRPSWIRMDVQGAELAALEGARETIRSGRGRLQIVVEMHPQLWPVFGLSGAEVETRLAALGLRARPLAGTGTAFAADGHAILDYR
jgi:FkbM family methyltransferase